MDNKSTMTRKGHSVSELEKFQLFYELVPVKKQPGRVKRTNVSTQ